MAERLVSRAPRALEKVFPGFGLGKFIFWVSVLQVIYYVVAIGLEGVELQPGNCGLHQLGAKFTPDIVLRGELHRLVLPILLHGSLLHLLTNLFFQFRMGFIAEKAVGTLRFVAIYVLGGLGGNVLSAYMDWYGLSVGASTALFAVFGAQGGMYLYHWGSLGPGRNLNVIVYLMCVFISFSIGFSVPKIDLSGHVGGFVSGGVLYFLVLRRDESLSSWWLVRVLSGVVFFGSLLSFWLILSGIQFDCLSHGLNPACDYPCSS